jgi:hypothetical protein
MQGGSKTRRHCGHGFSTLRGPRCAGVRSALGCRLWLEGGWGVEALVGHQTRPHRDIDLDLEARCEDAALAVLAGMGYTVETNWRPNRVELMLRAAAGRTCTPCSSTRTAPPGRPPVDGGFPRVPAVLLRHRRAAGIPVSFSAPSPDSYAACRRPPEGAGLWPAARSGVPVGRAGQPRQRPSNWLSFQSLA